MDTGVGVQTTAPGFGAKRFKGRTVGFAYHSEIFCFVLFLPLIFANVPLQALPPRGYSPLKNSQAAAPLRQVLYVFVGSCFCGCTDGTALFGRVSTSA